jgi:CcmD family protein
VVILGGALALSMAAPQTVRLQAATTVQQPSQEAPAGFVPASELPAQDQLPAAPLLVAAYGFAWVMILVYLWSLWRRLGVVEKEIADVARRIEEGRRR